MKFIVKFLSAILFLQFIIAPLHSQALLKDELLLVQALWRHGDRSPTDTFPSDPNKEDKWPQGWGQLTPLGMAQHVILGKKLAHKYIQQLEFISPQYKNKEIYLRSTDVNRTLTSAMSNMIGFYHSGVPGKDFPGPGEQAPWWPTSFTPVAIHTIQRDEDHILPDVSDCPCPRQEKLQEMIRETPEFKQMMEEKKWFFDKLSELSGQTIDVFNFWVIADTLFIEDIYEKKYDLKMAPWTKNQTLRREIEAMDDLFEDLTEGKGLKPFNGVNFGEELPRIRGGPILWIMIGNMQNKLACVHPQKKLKMAEKKSPLGSPICHWMEGKKYFAYSAHDTTIAALFSAFGFERTNFDREGFPHYSACVTLELWNNASSNEPYVKAFYWPPNMEGAEEITANITGCAAGCTLNQFVERSKIYQPTPTADAYCKNTHFPPKTVNGAQRHFKNFIYWNLFLAIILIYMFDH